MPELPEVETVRRVLAPQLCGKLITGLTAVHPQVLAFPGCEQFRDGVTGTSFEAVDRRGKFLLFRLRNGRTLTVHLRMTGTLLIEPPENPVVKHTHVILSLDDGKQLRFTDPRRFGRFWLSGAGEPDTVSGVQRLGIEPDDPQLTSGYLQRLFAGRRKAVKECLLDQSGIAGIGNIYSDEILFAARIHPARSAGSLSCGEWNVLADVIPAVMAYYVEKNTISAVDYLAGRGTGYRNTPFLNVYGRAGEPCRNCGTPLQRTVIGGRSSCFCPECQKPG